LILDKKGKTIQQWFKQPQNYGYIMQKSNLIPTLTPAVQHLSKIVDFFNYFIDDYIVDKIVYCTNKRLKKEDKPINLNEIRAFFGLLLLFGVTKKNNIDVGEIWAVESIHHSDWASACMSRNRFKLICSKITLDDVDSRAERMVINPKLYKVDEIFDRFRKNLGSALDPGYDLCVDEQLYAFRGKCQFRQYIPSKPAKYGIKYWTICDVQTSYCLEFIIYSGKDETRATQLGKSVVLKLSEKYEHSGRCITADNYFSSLDLARELYNKGLTFLGTLKKNRIGVPIAFMPEKSRDVDSSLFGFDKYLTIVSYVPKKNKAVLLISTKHHDAYLDSKSKKPEIIISYNKSKGGVDTLDHLIELSTCRRKTNRWTFNVLMNMLDIAASNAIILALIKSPSGKINTRKERRQSLEILSCDLIKEYVVERTRNMAINKNHVLQESIIQSIKRIGVHVTNKRLNQTTITTSNELNSNEKKRCELCARSKDRKTKIYCRQCERYICGDHSVRVEFILCKDCSNN
jgi:hypothetical protein